MSGKPNKGPSMLTPETRAAAVMESIKPHTQFAPKEWERMIAYGIRRAVEAERERCAEIADGWPSTFDGMVSPQGKYAAENIAHAIRAHPQSAPTQER